MELFNELQNSSLRLIVKTINKCISENKPASKTELQNLLGARAPISDEEKKLIAMLFTADKQNNNLLWPVINCLVPVMPEKIELQWLLQMLHDRRINGMLDNNLRQKLLSALQLKPLPEDCVREYGWNGPIEKSLTNFNDSNYSKIFKTALQAILSQNYVYYESHDIYGREYAGEAAPYKIEYCTGNHTFNLIMWNFEKNWTFKSDFRNITALKILNKNFDAAITAKADAYVQNMQTNAKPIILQLKATENNAFDRCFNMFANYNKEIQRTDKDKYILKIYHRDHFDQQEIEQNILSLGSSITVLEPASLKEKIISAIQQSFTR